MNQPTSYTWSYRLLPAVLICLLCFLLFSFQNCSKAQFSNVQKAGSEGELGGPDDGDGGDNDNDNDGDPDIDPDSDDEGYKPPKNPTVISSTCASLRASGQLLEFTQDLVFDDPRVETGKSTACKVEGEDRWEGPGNLPNFVNDRMQARYEQVRNLNLPEGAELCDLDIVMDEQRLKYDDMFYLSMNDTILATNHKNSLTRLDPDSVPLAPGSGNIWFYEYDWSRLVGEFFDNFTDVDYCLGLKEGLASCNWPKTEEDGEFHLDFDSEVLVRIGALSPDSIHDFRFAITADNDAGSDCYHEAFDFQIKAHYYLKTTPAIANAE